ncbi:MAG: thymidine kinase [Lactobacillaceae bacterium]|jgi:thymidine kinase|nr:thymidine kinase [Lactobacillaceae bacterium]
MTQLFFEYGAMGSGKTIEILKVAYNYEEQNKEVLLFTPIVADRDGKGIVASRIGLSKEAIAVSNNLDLFEYVEKELDKLGNKLAAVLVDEAQFLSAIQVDQLAKIVDELNIPVMAFGLKQDAFNELFEGSKRLLEVADKLVEMKTICVFCGKKATANMRVIDGKPVYSGQQVYIGGNESYIPTCRYHYYHPDLEKLKDIFIENKK